MSLDNLKIDDSVEVETKDVIHKGGGFLLDTGLYPMIISLAYMAKSKGGALSLNLHLTSADNSHAPVRQTLWVTSGDKKGNKPYYTSSKGKKIVLPGMQLAEHIAQVVCKKPFSALDTDMKTVKLYDYDTKGEVPTEVEVVTPLLNQSIMLGMHKMRENKNALNQASGKYEPTSEIRDFNEINKVFTPAGLTIVERDGGVTEPTFAKQWKTDYPSDWIRDRSKAIAAAPATPAGPVAAPVNVDDLFS